VPGGIEGTPRQTKTQLAYVSADQLDTISTAMPERTFAERLKAARKKIGKSQAEAAKLWKLNKRTLQDWERTSRIPAPLYHERIERILQRIEKD
jgi:DNA-binding transcriptional regulator YiaG